MDWNTLKRALRQHLNAQRRLGVRRLPFFPLSPVLNPAVMQQQETKKSHAPSPLASNQVPTKKSAKVARGIPLPEIPPPQPVLNAQSTAQQAHSLAQLQAAFANCQHCNLAKKRRNVVFGAGNASPQLLFLGEGPGADEDQQGQPFVGRSGRLLMGFIAALGLLREDVYITNMVKCRPPENRNPTAEETGACAPILKRQLALLKPRLIVTLGNVPLKALNPNAGGITRERGQIFSFSGYEVLPTFHPSYLLRNPNAIDHAWEDMRQAAQRVYPDF